MCGLKQLGSQAWRNEDVEDIVGKLRVDGRGASRYGCVMLASASLVKPQHT